MASQVVLSQSPNPMKSLMGLLAAILDTFIEPDSACPFSASPD